jgi:pimeloyl-ACP methyl ester carboxylesterase
MTGRNAGVPQSALLADSEAWRRAQNEHRVAEVHAALDGLNGQLRAANAELFSGRDGDDGGNEGGLRDGARPHFRALVERNVALIGHSFGGATAAACVLRDSADQRGPRFSHCFLTDPWVGGHASPLAKAELDARPFTPALRTMRVWLNEGSARTFRALGASTEALVGKARASGAQSADTIRVPVAGHHAQTDLPTVFESGPLSCFFSILTGTFDPTTPARNLLCRFIGEVLEPLLEQGWLAVGLSPLRP